MRHAAPALLALALLPVLAGCWIADFGELFNPDRCADEGDECGDGVPCCEGEGSCNYYASPPKCRRGIQYPYDNYDGYCGATGDRCSIDGNEGVCFDLKGGGVTECFATCANPGFECKISGTCYYTGFVEPFLCLPPGYKVPGEWCGAANECVAGATCLSYDGAVICFEVCNDANPCEEGSECTDTGLGFLVCVGLWDDRNGCVSLGGNCLFETCCEGFVCDYDTDLCVSLKTQLGDECRGDSWCASGQTCFQPKGVSVPGYCTLACSSDRQCDSETDVACCNDGLCQFVAGDTCGGRSGAIGSACTSGGNSDCSPGLFCDGTRFVDGRFAEGAYCTAYCADRNDCGPADHPVSGCMACGQTNFKERRQCFPIKDCIRGCRGDDDCNVAIGERCSVKRVDSDYGGPYVAWGCTGKCLAGALPPGSQCTSDSECCSPFCVRGKCAGPCLGDEDCTLGSQCVARLYVDVGMPGCASSLLTMCAPGGGSAKTCGSDGECPAGEDCAFWSFAGDEVVFRCRSPNAGGASFGGECTEDMDCQSGLCAPEGFCVSPCRTDSDCAAPGGAGVCGVAVLPRTGGVAACNPAVGSGSVCGRDGDCPPGEVCGAFRRLDGPRRFACVVPEKKGPGAACESDHECGTGLCLREYCAPVCASDTDCSPTSGLVWTCGMNEADSEGGAARACIPVAGSGAACGGNGDCAAPGEVCKPILVSETLLVGRCGVASNNGDAPGASAGEACAGCADPCLCRTVRCEADLCLAGRCVELCKETADCEEAGMVCDLPAGPGPGVCANRGS